MKDEKALLANIDMILETLPAGIDWYDIFASTSSSVSLSYKNNRLHSVTGRDNTGYGLRINRGGRTGFSYTNSPDEDTRTAERAASIAPWGDEERLQLPGPGPDVSFEPFSPESESFSIEHEKRSFEEAIDQILTAVPGASVNAGSGISSGATGLVNSNGFRGLYRHSSYSASISASKIFEDGTKIDTSEYIAGLAPEPFKHLADTLIGQIRLAEKTARLNSGRYPVIFSPGAFASLCGIVISGLSAARLFRGISYFEDKIGKEVFSPGFTVRELPSLAGSPYSYPFDDEGVKAEDKYLIRDRKPLTYITDLKYAEKTGVRPGGNASRGYASLPSPSLSNISVLPGSVEKTALIKSVKRGIYVERFIGLGQSNTLTGDFTGNLDLAFLIENGEMAGRLKDCMIRDNIFSLLGGSMALSSETERRGSFEAPSALFDSVSFTG